MRQSIRFLLFTLILQTHSPFYGIAQTPEYAYETFSAADSLRGALRPERTCFDISHYKLSIEVNIKEKSLSGMNRILFNMLEPSSEIQIDLFENMIVDSIIWNNKPLNFRRLYDAVFIRSDSIKAGNMHTLDVYYHGFPIEAKNAPWDGGFVWTTDNRDRPWIAVACEGTGASLWWPNKDHLSDEPDSMDVVITVDSSLECISNGVLVSKELKDDKSTFHWKVSYPINNYNISINIGHYVSFNQGYFSPQMPDLLKCNYYVLDYNLEKAKEHFNQVFGVLEAFENYLGPYPFWKDGYALIETPYLGMEHQSGIAYGNNYTRGYLGGMIPFDMNWDYIIVHETAHEWWGNAVSAKDHAEIWIHESFTTYMEALYVEYHFGYKDMLRYLKGQRRHTNRTPIVGPLDVNYGSWAGSDEYYKGSWIIHTFRQIVGDEVFFPLLKSFYDTYKYKTISTREFLDFVQKFTGESYDTFFTQYLYRPEIPTLLYSFEEEESGTVFSYRWSGCIQDFEMPVLIDIDGLIQKLDCSAVESNTLLDVKSKKDIKIRDDLMLIEKKKERK